MNNYPDIDIQDFNHAMVFFEMIYNNYRQLNNGDETEKIIEKQFKQSIEQIRKKVHELEAKNLQLRIELQMATGEKQ